MFPVNVRIYKNRQQQQVHIHNFKYIRPDDIDKCLIDIFTRNVLRTQSLSIFLNYSCFATLVSQSVYSTTDPNCHRQRELRFLVGLQFRWARDFIVYFPIIYGKSCLKDLGREHSSKGLDIRTVYWHKTYYSTLQEWHKIVEGSIFGVSSVKRFYREKKAVMYIKFSYCRKLVLCREESSP